MSRDTRRTEDAPFEAFLGSQPEEAPPADLRQRIVDALAVEAAKQPRASKPRGLWVPRLLAAAAVVVLITSTQMPRWVGGGGGERGERQVAQHTPPAPETGALARSSQGEVDRAVEAPMVALPPTRSGTAEVPDEPARLDAADPERVQGALAGTEDEAAPMEQDSAAADLSRTVESPDTQAALPPAAREPAEEGLGASASAEGLSSSMNGAAADGEGWAPEPGMPAAEPMREEAPMAAAEAPAGGTATEDRPKAPTDRGSPPADALAKVAPSVPPRGGTIDRPAPPANRTTPTPGYGLPEDFDAPQAPWRDTSEDRQMVTTSRMEVEVRDVEEAYDKAITVLERAHAVFLSQDMEILERGRASAHIRARVPLDQVDGVIAQIRDLGKVVRLASESVDRTRDYYGQGDEIRQGGATEDALVAEYEAERDPQRKEQLYQQIQALRQQVQGEKTRLEDLSEQTHSVLLEVTLTGRQGPIEFVAWALPDAGQAFLWVLGTAVFWGPLAIAAWIGWRRARAAV